MRFDAPHNREERLQRAHDRLALVASMLFATSAGDSIELDDAELGTLAGMLDDIRAELATVIADDVRDSYATAGGVR
jgi:hypothetical protein